MLNTINSLDQTMSSFEIAQITGKQHSHIMRDIRELNKVYEKLHQSKIGQMLKITELPNGAKRKDPYFELTKIQTWDLLTGYNAELRIKVNRRWAELEAQEQYHFPTPKIFNEVRCVHYMSWLLRNGYSLMSGQVRARIKKYPEQFRKTDKGWYMSEVESIEAGNHEKEIENAGKVLKYYREMIEDLGNKLKTAILELDEAKALIKELEDKIELLTDELKKYKQLNRKKEE